METEDRPRLIWPPEPGYFRMRLTAGAWGVPARIVQRDDGRWQAIIDGEEREAHLDPAHAPGVADIWQGARFIDQAEYDWLIEVKAHASRHGWTDHPALNPRTRIHPNRLRPIPYRPQQRTSP